MKYGAKYDILIRELFVAMEEPMDCAIWLGRKKIFSADDIADNFDIAAVRGYFLAGSLVCWLHAHGGAAYAEQLEQLDPADPALNEKLAAVFGQNNFSAPVHAADEGLVRAINSLRSGNHVTSSADNSAGGYSFGFGSRYGSFAQMLSGGSFGYGSLRYGSFSYGAASGSFVKTWQWEWEWQFGSFCRTGIGGSFAAAYAGSFGYDSFNFGSFGYMPFGSFTALPSSYKGVPLGGSFRSLTADEYDEIMYRCLAMCPLNRFGYGIHNI